MTPLARTGMAAPAGNPGFGPAQWSIIIAALIAALVAVAGYALTQAWTRREQRAKAFADALAAVEEYLEAPYRVRRRPGATPEVRAALTAALSDLQARIALHGAWLHVVAPAVGQAYDALVSAARAEGGTQMTEAWKSAPLTSDGDMNLKVASPHPQADAQRARVIAAMRRHLRLWPATDGLRRSATPKESVLPPEREELTQLIRLSRRAWVDAGVVRAQDASMSCVRGSGCTSSAAMTLPELVDHGCLRQGPLSEPRPLGLRPASPQDRDLVAARAVGRPVAPCGPWVRGPVTKVASPVDEDRKGG